MTCDDVFDILTRGPFPSGATEDEHVELHLTRCADCRRLATALRPAVELFQEAIEPDETHDLPGYRGRMALPGADDMHEQCQDKWGEGLSGLSEAGWRPAWIRADAASRRFGARPAPRSTHEEVRGEPPASFAKRVTRSRTNLTRFAAAVLLGVAAAAGARGIVTYQATSADIPEGAPPVALVGAARLGDHGEEKRDLRWLAGLVLPASCTPNRDAAAAAERADGLRGVQLASAHELSRFECCTDCHRSATAGLIPAESRTVVVRACTVCH